MNNLDEKLGDNSRETDSNEEASTNRMPSSYKKLGVYLLLLYQAYLQRETLLEPEIKAAIWRMVQFKEDFPARIRMVQMELLAHPFETLDGEWDLIKDSLFPIKEEEITEAAAVERQDQLKDYKKTVFGLLNP